MSKSFSVTLSNSARAVVTYATKGERVVYGAYIADHGVTLDTVAEHVQSLASLAVEMKAVDGEDKEDVKRFKNKVRNGLNRTLGKPDNEGSNKSGKYVTAEGLKAESWDDFVLKARAEWVAANETK